MKKFIWVFSSFDLKKPTKNPPERDIPFAGTFSELEPWGHSVLSGGPLSKWRPFNNSVIFQPICFKIEYKVDRRIGNDVATPLQSYGAVGGAAAPFPAAPL